MKEVALKVVLALAGTIFLALTYPLIMFVRQDPSMSMMFSISTRHVPPALGAGGTKVPGPPGTPVGC